MLSPVDIKNRSFKSGMGYSKADVDGFLSTVASDFETLYRENMELKEKLSNLNETINHYRSIEKALQKALILAEQTAEETISSAKTNATVIEQEAVLKAQSLVADAKIELEQIHTKTVDLLQQYEKYRSQFQALAQAQADMLASDAFNIQIASLEAFENLEKEAARNTAAVNAKVQYQDIPADAQNGQKASPENLSEDAAQTDDEIQISDLASFFDQVLKDNDLE